MTIQEEAHRMKLASPLMAAATAEERNQALDEIRDALTSHKKEIFEANRADLARADADAVSDSVKKRLRFDEKKLSSVLAGIDQVMSLPDPIGKVLLDRELDQNLELRRVRVPIGVIGVIFEARPDALVQISSLCIKSGNCAILKGGKETRETNRILFSIIKDAAVKAGLPDSCLYQAEAHSEIDELLQCDRDVDLLIPRGSNAFVRYIMDHTRIPVMGHADGVCHTYVDRDADQDAALRILVDAKTQYAAACNATETVLIDRAIAGDFLPKLSRAFREAGVRVRGNQESLEALKKADFLLSEDPLMQDEDYHKEYLDLVASVKLVDGVQEAVSHINRFGSHHTDAILTENDQTAAYFLQMVDSAGVYRNCSTRFADGFRYGFGAEVGISTNKLHARGPVGMEGLMTYKYELIGHGQIVGDYADGKASFHFRDLKKIQGMKLL
ncbi:MAG: glutamate-5-semialdehyde dehydrogenase [Lachnospiraceae bacterium]|nr:glutamate-5-semialdehyde dehydrogenase [Lachnospiraceae bacterium]